MKTSFFTQSEALTTIEKAELVDFLYNHLDQFGDSKEAILKAIDYALLSYPLAGGFVLIARENNDIIGAVVMNKTGMEEYIPENILVYIAVHKKARGKGVGKQLMKEAIKMAKGNIALHVEPDNPAKYLYEKLGFENKYLEMRLTK
jgi:[ribosomal protein S18]-alanine N-acetyltransferase